MTIARREKEREISVTDFLRYFKNSLNELEKEAGTRVIKEIFLNEDAEGFVLIGRLEKGYVEVRLVRDK